MSRYIIYPGSKSAHCCFEATVMDSTKPEIIGGEQYEDEDGKHYETVCECFSMEDAELVCRALNSRERMMSDIDDLEDVLERHLPQWGTRKVTGEEVAEVLAGLEGRLKQLQEQAAHQDGLRRAAEILNNQPVVFLDEVGRHLICKDKAYQAINEANNQQGEGE